MDAAMTAAVAQWALPLLLYFLVVATRVHEIICVLPCHTLATGTIMALAGPAALLSPGSGPVHATVWTFLLWALLNIVMYVAIPFAFSSGPWRPRLYMVVHLASIFLISRLLVLALDHLRAALGYGSASPLMARACDAVMEIGFILVLCQLTDRFALRIIPRAGGRAFDPFLFFSALQCFMIGTSVIVISLRGVTDPRFLVLTFVFAALCLLTDLALGAVIWMEHDMRAKQHKADAQQTVFDSYLTSTETLMRRAETMAKRRHDARNQLAVIQLLVDRGQIDQARTHIDELRAECAKELRP